MLNRQKTIKTPSTVIGRGLHTGNNVTLTFFPAPINFGYQFQRTDIEGNPFVSAVIENVTETSRGTTIEQNGVKIQTVEHVLSALFALSIDNVIIQINNSETPILDGSSREFYDALIKSGIVEQEADRKVYELDTAISYFDSKNEIEIIAIPSDRFRVSMMVDYNTHILNSQNAYLNDLKDFGTEIAGCRTFVFLHELEHLVSHNLIKGGDLDNAIVFVDKLISSDQLEHLKTLFNKPDVQVMKEGILNNVDLYFTNEPARHKLLDVIGDLALIGFPINAHIIAKRSGHASNVHFAKLLKNHIQYARSIKHVPVHLNGHPPVYTNEDILKIIPQKKSFIIVDKIVELDDNQIVGVKNVLNNEPYLEGHFNNERMMPGILLIEAIAQTGSILALNQYSDPENYRTYLVKINNVKFTDKVFPGSKLVIVVSPVSKDNDLANMNGTVFVDDQAVAEAEIHIQIQKKQE